MEARRDSDKVHHTIFKLNCRRASRGMKARGIIFVSSSYTTKIGTRRTLRDRKRWTRYMLTRGSGDVAVMMELKWRECEHLEACNRGGRIAGCGMYD